jgi:hypothetical protein
MRLLSASSKLVDLPGEEHKGKLEYSTKPVPLLYICFERD